MYHDDLLRLAGQCNFAQEYYINLAYSARTAQDVAQLQSSAAAQARRYAMHAKWFARVAKSSFVAVVMTGLALAFGMRLPAGPLATLILLIGGLTIFGGTTVAYFFASDASATHVSLQEQLKPVLNAELCGKALEYIESGLPAVLRWRDLVVAERRVLCVFDLVILKYLHFASVEADKAASRAQEDEDARNRLYGAQGTGARTQSGTCPAHMVDTPRAASNSGAYESAT